MKQVQATPEIQGVGEDSPALSVEEQNKVITIASLGEVRKDFEVMGHSFTMHSLTERELIEVSSYSAAYAGTRAANMAFRMYAVAAALDLVDGEPLYQPLSEQEETLGKRGDIVGEWYPSVIDALYTEYAEITKESDNLVKKLKK